MAAVPLTLETSLQTTANTESARVITPLPQLKTEAIHYAERPSNLTLVEPQHSHNIPSSALSPASALTLGGGGSISPVLSSTGSLSPSFLPEMPQWKRDLIQRRKQNVQRTLSASSQSPSQSPSPSPSVATAAVTLSATSSNISGAGGALSGVLKKSTSLSSSVRSLAGSNTNIDQLAAADGLLQPQQQHSLTKDYTTLKVVNKQQYAATTTSNAIATNTTKPATISYIKSSSTTSPLLTSPLCSSSSPLKEKAERLFGGQYTATTKEEIFTQTQQQQQKYNFKKENHTEEMAENNIKTKEQEQEFVQAAAEEEVEVEEAETYEMLKKTKEIQEEQLHEEQINETATIIIKTSDITNKQQLQQQTATRLTGSTCTTTHTSSSTLTSTSSSSSSLLLTKRTTAINNEYEREHLASYFSGSAGGGGGINSHSHSITGANVNIVNQLLTKCESERLVCAANTTTTTVNNTNIQNSSTTGYSNNYFNNLNNSSVSATIGGNTGVNNNNSNNNSSSNSSSSSGVGNNSGGLNSVSVANVVKISQKLQENQFIKNEQQQLQQQQQKKFLRYQKFNNTTTTTTATAVGGGGVGVLDLKSPTRTFLTTSSSSTSLSLSSPTSSVIAAASATALGGGFNSNCAIKKKMVAVQEMKKSTQNSATHLHPISTTCNNSQQQQQQQQQQQLNRALATNRGVIVGGGGVGGINNTATDLDTSEDLSYGPGIVSKLRCRYLSLALRESMEQQRLNKDHLRRSTSLNNLLDNTTEDDDDDEEEEEEDLIDGEVVAGDTEQNNENKDLSNHHHLQMNKKTSGILKSSLNNGQEKRFSSTTHNSQGSNGVGVTFTETTFTKRSRHLKRGNDSLKRARSVEALLSEKSPWQIRANSSTNSGVSIEDKIQNARERLHQGTDHMPPKRLTSIIDDTERPPPDLVKQTLKKFEATANRRPRLNSRSNSKGDVASKVETFKNIEKKQKPVVNYPKPISPTKKLQKPLKTSTPQANDLLQSPIGRKVMATANAIGNNLSSANDTATTTPLKSGGSGNTLSEHTPDIIPRQTQTQQTKFTTNERDFKQNKELFVSKEKASVVDILKRGGEHNKEKTDVVSTPVTALTKEFSKFKISSKSDNFCSLGSSSSSVSSSSLSDNRESESVKDGGGGGVSGNVDFNIGDACQRYNKYPYNNSNNDETTNQQQQQQQQELNINTLKNENDKIINNKTKQMNNETSSSSSPLSSSLSSIAANATIEMKNEATTVKNYENLLVKTATASPPASSSDLSDGGNEYDVEDVEYGGNTETNATTKRITRTALDNIAKAGFTQQFKFNNSQQQQQSTTISCSSSSTSSPLNAGKQIGVIRPLLNTQTATTTTKTSLDNNMETLNHTHTSTSTTSPLTSREIEKNRINDMKKSTSSSSSSPSSTSLDNVIKSSPVTASAGSTTNATSGVGSSTGFSDVDTVISATNSPLWAMRKRRQTPPAAPAENTTMVFNFSNRKEVPDYIDNDGVIFRRKRELPKPNESGFVLLGDLSVETSTDMDYDDFSMCPPSPCDVEFTNANIVIDGKSSIRQKSKETTHYRVQFNDTLNSTFEYPSAASLCMDDSFSAYNENYTQPHGSNSLMANDLSQAFQNLCLENQQQQQQHHHVADEIIQLPTLNASLPAATNNTSSPLNTSSVGGGSNATPTKNILGNLPLDYPDSEKGIRLTNNNNNSTLDTQGENAPPATANHHNDINEQNIIENKKKSRKDLKLPLNLQKPPLPVKRLEMISPVVAPKFINSTNLQANLKPHAKTVNQVKQETTQKDYPASTTACKEEVDIMAKPKPRKIPSVLDKPQYACFLQSTNQDIKYPIHRSRSNEFQKTFSSYLTSTTHVTRSNSLRNLDNFPLKRAPCNTTTTTSSSNTTTTNGAAHVLYFSAEVNSKNQFSLSQTNEKAKMASNAYEKSPNATMPAVTLDHHSHELNFSHTKEVVTYRSQSFLNLQSHNQEFPGNSKEFEFKSQSLSDLAYKTKIIESPYDVRVKSLDNFNSTETEFLENPDLKAKSLENFNTSLNHINSPLATLQINSNNNNEDNLIILSQNSLKISDHEFKGIRKDMENQNTANLAAPVVLNETVVKDKTLENFSSCSNSENTLEILEKTVNNSIADLATLSENLLKITDPDPREHLNIVKAKLLENLGDNSFQTHENNTLATLPSSNDGRNKVHSVALLYNSAKIADINCKVSFEGIGNENITNLAAYSQVKESEMEVRSLENLHFPLNTKNSLKNVGIYKEDDEHDLAALTQNLLKTIEFETLSEENVHENQIKVLENSHELLQEIENKTIATLANSNEVNNEESILPISADLLQHKSESKVLESLSKSISNEEVNLAALEDLQENATGVLKQEKEEFKENCLGSREKIVNLTKKTEEELKGGADPLKLCKESEDVLNVIVNTENINEVKGCKSRILHKREYKSPQTLSFTINTDYLTGYSSSMTHKPKNPKTDIFKTENSLSLSVNRGIEIKSQSKSEENLTSSSNLLDKTESNVKSLSCENVSDVIEYNLHKNVIENHSQEKEEKKTPPEFTKEIPEVTVATKTINLGHLNKSLQMSLDSLDDYEDALASNTVDFHDSLSKACNNEAMEAADILEDIAVGMDSESMFDFKNLLTLKRSRTEYCLKDLNKSKSFSVDSSHASEGNDDGDESEETFNSACNTLESKASLKPQRPEINKSDSQTKEKIDLPVHSQEAVEPQSSNKSNKTLRCRTTEKILHFTHHASQNVSSSYATFRKSKNFYKNASKSFKNSLKFYETFNEKPSNQLTLVTRQQTPMNLGKKAEQNRKIFSKSSKLNKSKSHENLDSPTENSYSFEYFDAESDRNGNLTTSAAVMNLRNQKLYVPGENKVSFVEASPVMPESNNLKLPSLTNEFYFNNSPRPFKRVYEDSPLITNKESVAALTCNQENDQSLNALEYKSPISFVNSSLRIKPFKASTELNTSKENTAEQLAKASLLEPGASCAFKTPSTVNTTLRSRSFSVADSIKFYNNTEASTRNSFFSRSLHTLGSPSSLGGAPNTLGIPLREIRNTFSTNNLAVCHSEFDNSRNSYNFSTQSLNNLVNTSFLCSTNVASLKKETPSKGEIPAKEKPNKFSTTTYGNSGYLDNFLGNSLTSNGSNSLQYVGPNYDVSQPFKQPLEGSSNNFNQISENFNNPTPKIYTNTKYLALKTKTPTPTTTPTLMVKDLTNQNTTPTTSTTTTTCVTSTITTSTTTNFPTKVVVLKQQQTLAKNVSYTTSSSSTFSSIFSNKKTFNAASTTTTNANSITGKYYHHNLKATPPPSSAPPVPPLKKKFTTKPSTKVLTQRFKDCTTTCTTATTTTTYCSTTTSCTTTCLKTTPTSCHSSGNNIIAPAPPLRRRIPGNTLYYV